MLLKTERLTIRHICVSDWHSIKAIWESVNATAFSAFDKPHNTDDEDVRAKAAKWADAASGTGHLFFAICLGDTVIGYCAFNIRESEYELGYCFHTDYHGKGYAKESLLALFDYLKELGITSFTAGTALKNTPSVALLRSLGFTQTGTEKVSFYKDANGDDIVFDGGIFKLSTTQNKAL